MITYVIIMVTISVAVSTVVKTAIGTTYMSSKGVVMQVAPRANMPMPTYMNRKVGIAFTYGNIVVRSMVAIIDDSRVDQGKVSIPALQGIKDAIRHSVVNVIVVVYRPMAIMPLLMLMVSTSTGSLCGYGLHEKSESYDIK